MLAAQLVSFGSPHISSVVPQLVNNLIELFKFFITGLQEVMSSIRWNAVSTRLPMKCLREQRRNESLSESFTTSSWTNGSSSETTSTSYTTSSECRSNTSNHIYLWPGGKVFYCFEPEYTTEQRAHVLTAIRHIEHATKLEIDFIEIEEEPADDGGYLYICFGDSYEATLGFIPDLPTTLALPEAALNDKLALVIHEILHALGIRHEHNRPDRDKFVEVCWENIKHDERHNFYRDDNYETFGLPYNYYSVMHYPTYSFCLDGTKPTLIFKDKSISKQFVGQRCFVTMEDLDLLRKKYIYEAPGKPEKLRFPFLVSVRR